MLNRLMAYGIYWRITKVYREAQMLLRTTSIKAGDTLGVADKRLRNEVTGELVFKVKTAC